MVVLYYNRYHSLHCLKPCSLYNWYFIVLYMEPMAYLSLCITYYYCCLSYPQTYLATCLLGSDSSPKPPANDNTNTMHYISRMAGLP